MAWSCICESDPCTGLDCGVYLPGRAPRKQSHRPTELLSDDRKRAWATRRAKYGANGHG